MRDVAMRAPYSKSLRVDHCCPDLDCEYAKENTKRLKNMASAVEHWHNKHNPTKPNACSFLGCSESFPTRGLLQKHHTAKHKSGRFICSCNFTFKAMRKLQQHVDDVNKSLKVGEERHGQAAAAVAGAAGGTAEGVA
jgi:hypothetical protein